MIAAPASGALRLALWLSGARALQNTRMAAIEVTLGANWRTPSDQWPALPQAQLRAAMLQIVRARGGRLQRIEADDRFALNVTRLAEAFPRARFVYLYRDVRESLARMLDVWSSDLQPHPSGVQLRDGRSWKFPLAPGWSACTGKPPPEIAAWQWSTLTRNALDALESLAAERWCITSYDRLISHTDAEHLRLRQFLGLRERDAAWRAPRFRSDDQVSPDQRLWQHHGNALAPVLAIAARQADRAVRLFAESPQTRARKH